MKALEESAAHVFGKAYFISQGDPVNMWEWIDQILVRHGVKPVTRSISKSFAMTLALGMEGVAKLLGLCGIEYKPLLTRFLVSEMSTHHYFSIEAAKRDLGYLPSCTIQSAMEKAFPVDGDTAERVEDIPAAESW
jgi:nucleoside-diphosphate-sugar epimerase